MYNRAFGRNLSQCMQFLTVLWQESSARNPYECGPAVMQPMLRAGIRCTTVEESPPDATRTYIPVTRCAPLARTAATALARLSECAADDCNVRTVASHGAVRTR